MLADPFQITFVWQGPGTPGEQTFNVLNTDPLTSDYGLVGNGTTQLAPIPEPYSYTLLAVGLVLVAGWARRARLLS